MPYEYDPERIIYFGATDARGGQVPFGIKALDRMRHMYIIGKTGMGKSTMLENMAIQDIQNGEGIAFIDPHGSTAEKLLEFVPESRIEDVVYFAPFDTEFPVGFNVMEDVGYDKRHLVVAGLMSAFQRIWVDAWSARMEYILQNVLLALLEYPDTTLIDVNRMLINKEFRAKVTEYVTDPIVKRFWQEEFAGYTDRYTQEATPAIQNKIGQFVSNPLVRNIIGQPHSSFDLRRIMDERKIFIVNLSKGRMGEQNADLLGSILTTKMYLSAMSRAENTQAELAQLPPFYLYVDEFQSVVNDSFANILSEARKYKLALTIAHQYIEQVDEHIRSAVFGNVGTTITFRVGPFDAETLKPIFEPTFYVEDLVNLGFAQIYLTLMIDGIGSQPFSATTLPPVEHPPFNFVNRIVESSREKYARIRAQIEDAIRAQNEEMMTTKKKKKKKKKKGGGGGETPADPTAQPRTDAQRNALREALGAITAVPAAAAAEPQPPSKSDEHETPAPDAPEEAPERSNTTPKSKQSSDEATESREATTPSEPQQSYPDLFPRIGKRDDTPQESGKEDAGDARRDEVPREVLERILNDGA